MLPIWRSLNIHPTDMHFDFIKDIISKTELSSYLIEKDQFFIIENDRADIVSFWRIFDIGDDACELSSLRVDPEYRWYKLGIYLSEVLMKGKYSWKSLYLATKQSLIPYYNTLWFRVITDWIPLKLIHTQKRATSQWTEFFVMKYA